MRFAAFLWIIPLREALSIKPVAVAKVAFASSGEPVSVTATTLRAALRIAALIGAFLHDVLRRFYTTNGRFNVRQRIHLLQLNTFTKVFYHEGVNSARDFCKLFHKRLYLIILVAIRSGLMSAKERFSSGLAG